MQQNKRVDCVGCPCVQTTSKVILLGLRMQSEKEKGPHLGRLEIPNVVTSGKANSCESSDSSLPWVSPMALLMLAQIIMLARRRIALPIPQTVANLTIG